MTVLARAHAHRRHWLAVALLGAAIASLLAQSSVRGVDTVGSFQLDAQNYQVLEGTALTVTVTRTGGGILDRDIQVKVAMADGTEDFDYTPGQLSLTFPIGTNLVAKQATFQTLNQDRNVDKNVTVKILAVSGGTIGAPSASNVKILGSRVLRVSSVFARAVTPGTAVTVRGSGFLGKRDDPFDDVPCNLNPAQLDGVFFGAIQALSCTLISDSEMTVVYPGGAPPGPISVRVRRSLDPGGETGPNPPADSFWPATTVAVHSLTPSSGPGPGGNIVEIRGQGFTAATRVFFRPAVGPDVEATRTLINPSQINAVAPPGSLPVDIVVREGAAESPKTTDTRYQYLFGPIVVSISPRVGPAVGGTEVTITGANFNETSVVTFGGVAATSVIFTNAARLIAVSPPGTGAVDVIVNSGGTLSPNTTADDFSYSAPNIREIVPNAGPPAGGTKISIRGNNFTVTSVVYFGTVRIDSEFVSPEEIRLTTKASRPGATAVKVVNASGQSADHAGAIFTFTDGPLIESLNPSLGPTSGGTAVVIAGKNFSSDATITVGGVAVTSLNVNSDKIITFITPPSSAAGFAEVRVTTVKAQSPVSSDSLFRYVASAPVILALAPDSGPTFGGTEVTILGAGFLGASCPGSVMFGLVPAPSCTVVDGNKIIATSPPHFASTVIVTVVTSNGISQLTENFTYKTASGGGNPPPGGGGAQPSNLTYNLTFRWSLVTWGGPDAVDIASALKGTSSVVASDNISALIFGVYEYDPVNEVWIAFINAPVPGVSDLTTFKRGTVYWIGMSFPGTIAWNVVSK